MNARLGITGALALAAASTGVVVPALRELVEHAGHGPATAGVFMAAHVLGGVIGASLGARALRRIGSARTLAALGLGASVAIVLAMAALDSLAVRIALRFVDGGCHLLAITALVAAATAGEPELRARRAVTMGLAIVLGVAAGFGVGAALARPALALVVAAAVSAAALTTLLAGVAAEPLPEPAPAPRAASARRSFALLAWLRTGIDRSGAGPLAPGLLSFGERFIFGTLSVATPFLAPPARVGLVLGVAMTASVVAMPIARRYAQAWGARRLAVRSTLGFAATLAASGAIDVFGSPVRALVWAIACGAAAGALYASALVLVARSAALDDRMRDMGAVHAAGSAGFALGALSAGVLVPVLAGGLVIAVPGIAIIALATLGVWITVPEAARDCPLVTALATPPRPISERFTP